MHPTSILSGFISRYIAVILIAASALFIIPKGWADDFVVDVITLHHRTTAELLPVLQDFVAKDGVIKAADDKLIIRTHPANLTELRALIAKLDTPQRMLLITVKQLSGEAAHQAGAIMKSQSTANDQATHSVQALQTDTSDHADREQQVRVLDGGEAFIDMGREIPISDFARAQSHSGVLMKQETRYVGATTGFYVHPHLTGDTVSIDITPFHTTQSGIATPPEFNTQALHLTVSGKLGEWLTIGSSSVDTDDKDKKIIEYSTSRRDAKDRRILLRATELP